LSEPSYLLAGSTRNRAPWVKPSRVLDKIITAIISWATVLALIPLAPKALALPGLPLYMIDPNGVVLSRNSGAERVIGYAESEIVGRHLSCFYPEEERLEDRPALEILKATRTGKYHEENWRIREDGTHFWADVTLTPMRNDTGRLRGFAKITRDITERKNAEDHIQKQLARLHLINQITEAIAERQDLVSIYRVVLSQLEDDFQMDFNAICSFGSHSLGLRIEAGGPQSQSLSDQLGLKIGQALFDEKNWLGECVRGTLSYILDLAEVDEGLFKRMAGAGLRCAAIAPIAMGGKTMGLILTARRERDAYDSGDCEFLQKLSCHAFLAGQHAMLYQELKTAYDDLRQSQKHVLQQESLSALGQMASGIVHDINNAISPISLYVESLLEGDHQFTSRTREYLTTIARAIDDVAKTVSRMRDFYRLQEKATDLQLADLTSLTQQVLDLTRPRWRDQAQANGITPDAAAGYQSIDFRPPARGRPVRRGPQLELNQVEPLVYTRSKKGPEHFDEHGGARAQDRLACGAVASRQRAMGTKRQCA